MTTVAVSREVQLRVATAGASAVTGNVALTLALDDLAEIPVVYGPTVRPIEGASEMRPYPVTVLDTGGQLSSAFATSGRWALAGRLAELQYRDDGGSWTTYGTGRIVHLDEERPGAFRLEIADESWKARRGGVFTVADTTMMWPTRVKAPWRGWADSGALTGFVVDQVVGLTCVRVLAGQFVEGKEIVPALLRYAESDLIEHPVVSSGATAGNFDTLRLRYHDTDYAIVSFSRALPGIVGGPSLFQQDPLKGLKEPIVEVSSSLAEAPSPTFDPEKYPPYSQGRVVSTFVWVVGSGLPDGPVNAYVHAPTGVPSPENPLHIGLSDSGHDWGTSLGGIHPATLTRRVWEALGVVYDNTALSAIESDTSLPKLWLRVTETPENIEAWMQAQVWGPLMLAPGRTLAGARTLIDLRMPQAVDPDTLPVIDASNANAPSWSVVGRDAVNSVEFAYLHTSKPSKEDAPDAVLSLVRTDGLIVEERKAERIQGDTVEAIGERVVSLSLTGALEPTADPIRRQRASGAPLFGTEGSDGTIFDELADTMAEQILDLYQDGPVHGRLEIGRTVAETLVEGAVVVLDHASLQIPNPATGARSGLRLVRILTMDRHPAYAAVEYLDMGAKAAILSAPTVDIVQDGEEVVVTVGSVPAGATAMVEVAYTATSDAPASWPRMGRLAGNGALTFGDAPATGYAHARVRAMAKGRISSTWATDNVQLTLSPRIRNLTVQLDAAGRAVVRGDPNAFCLGVRLRYAIHRYDDVLTFGSAIDIAAASLAAGHLLMNTTPDPPVPQLIPPAKMVTVSASPWTEFTGTTVDGTEGPTVTASRARKLFDRPLAPTVEFVVNNRYLDLKDPTGVGPRGDGPKNGDKKIPRLPQDWTGGTVLPSGVLPEMDSGGRSGAGDLPPGTIDLSTFDLDRIGFPRTGKMAIDLGFRVYDPSGKGGLLSVWTNPTSEKDADPTGIPDAVIAIDSTDPYAEVLPEAAPEALEKIKIPATGFGEKRMYARFDSVTGATSGLVPPFDQGYRALANSSGEMNDGEERGGGGGRSGFDTRYNERLAIIEEMNRDFLAGFAGERYLTPKEIKDSSGLFTLMDGEGKAIKNLVLEDTVTDEGERVISLFLAKPSSEDPDDLDGVSDGTIYRRVVSVDSNGQLTAASIKAGEIEAFHLTIGTLSEITDDLGILVSGQLVGTSVILDLGADSSDPILECANLAVYADGDAFFAGVVQIDTNFGQLIDFLYDGTPVGSIESANGEGITLTAGGFLSLVAPTVAIINLSLHGEAVSFGANNSAGSGFRLLRVPNA